MPEKRKTRIAIAASARVRWLPPLILLAAAAVVSAQPTAEIEGQAANAARFAKLFLAGQTDELHAMMTPRMQVAFTAVQQEQIRSGLTRQYGVVERLGEAWMEIALPVGDGDRALPGLLALPDGPGPFPAVVLVHGSGALDKNETIGPKIGKMLGTIDGGSTIDGHHRWMAVQPFPSILNRR